MGMCYLIGEGVEQSNEEALKMIISSAKSGYTQAQYTLGIFYNVGKIVAKDSDTAAVWFKEAAEQGHNSSLYELGKCYYAGVGVAQDHLMATKCFEKAIAQEHILAKREKEKCYFSSGGAIETKNMAHIYQYLQDNVCFGKVTFAENDEVVIHTGCMYNDMTKMILCIVGVNNQIVITDGGRTYDYLDSIFELDVIKNIFTATDYFGVKHENKILSIVTDSPEKISKSILRIFYYIVLLNTMKIFYGRYV